jgi:hypothetical protein
MAIHPEISYAERCNADVPEKVSSLEGSQSGTS